MLRPELVRQIMRHANLMPCQPCRFRTTTAAERPGIKFIGEITYLLIWQGFIYLATAIGCSSKKVIG